MKDDSREILTGPFAIGTSAVLPRIDAEHFVPKSGGVVMDQPSPPCALTSAIAEASGGSGDQMIAELPVCGFIRRGDSRTTAARPADVGAKRLSQPRSINIFDLG